MFDLIPLFITPSAPVTTGIVIVSIFHILIISISKSLYFENFSIFYSYISVRWYRHINQLARVVDVVFNNDVRFISFISLFVCTCISHINPIWTGMKFVHFGRGRFSPPSLFSKLQKV